MDHRLTLTGLQDAVGARKAGGLDVVYTKLAVDLQNLATGADDPVLAAALDTLREETACDAIAVILLDDARSARFSRSVPPAARLRSAIPRS